MEPRVRLQTEGTTLEELNGQVGFIENCEWIGEGSDEDSDGFAGDYLYTVRISGRGSFKVNGTLLEHL